MFVLTAEAAGNGTELLDAVMNLTDNNSRKFTKTGGQTQSVRQEFDKFLNRQKSALNKGRKDAGQTLLTQYDVARMIAADAELIPKADIYRVGDRLAAVVCIEVRPVAAEIIPALNYLAQDWADDNRNVYTSWDELSPDVILEDVLSTVGISREAVTV